MTGPSETFIGSRIHRLVARQFWLDGELISSNVPVFIEDIDGICWKLWFDDEEWVWGIERSEEACPGLGSELGDITFRYKHVEPSGAQHLVNQKVISFDVRDTADYVEASILTATANLTARFWFQTEIRDLAIRRLD